MIMTTNFTVRRLEPMDFADLRQMRLDILRPGMPPSTAHFVGDELPRTVHLGAFDRARLVGIATLIHNRDLEFNPAMYPPAIALTVAELIAQDGYVLRGMATDPTVRGGGAGGAVMRAMQAISRDENRMLWCNARTVAVGFYARYGWTTESEEFDIPGISPHYIMRWLPDAQEKVRPDTGGDGIG